MGNTSVYKNYIDTILKEDKFGVRTGILHGKKYTVLGGYGVYLKKELVGILRPCDTDSKFKDRRGAITIDVKKLAICNKEEIEGHEKDCTIGTEIFPFIAEFINDDLESIHDDDECRPLAGQIEFSEKFNLGEADGHSVAAGVNKVYVSWDEKFVYGKGLLLDDWVSVYGADDAYLSKGIGSCTDIRLESPGANVFEGLEEFFRTGFFEYKTNSIKKMDIPEYLSENAVLTSKYLPNHKDVIDITDIFDERMLATTMVAIHSVYEIGKDVTNEKDLGEQTVRNSQFCIFDFCGVQYLAKTTDLVRNRFNVGELKVFYALARDYKYVRNVQCFLTNVVKAIEYLKNIKIQATFVFPAVGSERKVYLTKGNNDEYTLSMVIPYYEDKVYTRD